MHCDSSQQAIQLAAQAIMSGTQDVVIAAGAATEAGGVDRKIVPIAIDGSFHAKDKGIR